MNQNKFVDEEAPEGAVKEVAAQDILGTLALKAADRRAIRDMAMRVKKRPDGGIKGQPLPSRRELNIKMRSKKELRKFYKKTTYSAIEIIESWIASLLLMSEEEMKKHKIIALKKSKAVTQLTDAKIYLSEVIKGQHPIIQRHHNMFERSVIVLKGEEPNGGNENTLDGADSSDSLTAGEGSVDALEPSPSQE